MSKGKITGNEYVKIVFRA